MMKTILIVAKDGVDVSQLMGDIFRQFEPRIQAISNSAKQHEAIDTSSNWPWNIEDYPDGEEG
jgi:hypothetical protein